MMVWIVLGRMGTTVGRIFSLISRSNGIPALGHARGSAVIIITRQVVFPPTELECGVAVIFCKGPGWRLIESELICPTAARIRARL